MLEALIALAALAGNTVVAAATTDAWEACRRGFARLLGRGDARKIELAEQRLAETQKQLTTSAGADLERVRAVQEAQWATRLTDLLEEDPGVEAELRALVEEIRAQLPAGVVSTADHSVAAGGDVNISATGGGVAAGVIHGGCGVAGPYTAGPGGQLGGPGFAGDLGPGSIFADRGGTAIGKVVQQRPGVTGKPVRLAAPPPLLAGREELLAELDARLTGGDAPEPRIVALCGFGGIGKTSVAVAYAHRHLTEVGLVWQFAAYDLTVLEAEFSALAAQLGARDVVDTRDPVASVHGMLAAFPGRWLLIFDNVRDRASVERFLPPAGSGRVLITSQNPDWPHGQAVQVPVLDAESAAAFLVTRTGDGDQRAAQELAGELDGLPLALEQAAAYILATGASMTGYLGLFRQRRAEMLSRGEPTAYPGTVATTWSLAFTQLEQSAPEAIGLLRLLAFCAPDAIPLHLLLRPRPGLTEGLIPQVAVVLVPLLEDVLAANDAIAALRQYSLVSPVGDGTVYVHRLVQAVTADRMPEELAAQWRQATAAVIEAAIPVDPSQPETWPACALLLPHALAALAPGSLGMLHIANYVGYSGSYAVARDLYQKALEALGPEHPISLVVRGTLADWAGQAGDVAAARDQWAALLWVYERVLGPEHPDTLHARGNLAAWVGQAGDAAGARNRFAALLPVAERVLGAEDRYTLSIRNNLARWTGQAGDAAGARDRFAALLPVVKRTLGAEHPGTLTARGNLAAWTGQAGDAAKARDQLAELLPVRERVLGPEHPDTLTTRNNLAFWTGKAGDAAGARGQFAELLPVRERVLGPDHPDTIVTRGNLADWTRLARGTAGAGDQSAALDPAVVRRDDTYRKVGRNAPCPCGSGRKFKRCHGDPRMRDAPG